MGEPKRWIRDFRERPLDWLDMATAFLGGVCLMVIIESLWGV